MAIKSSGWGVRVLALGVTLLAAGCGSGVSGMYGPVFAPDQSSMFPYAQIEFRSGGKAQVHKGEGGVVEVTYATEGKQVKITDDGKTVVYEVDSAGCLKGGKDIAYCKAPTKVDGLTYVTHNGTGDSVTIAFKSGGKAQVATEFDKDEATYSVKDDQVALVSTDKKNSVDLVLGKGGCLDLKGREGSANYCPLYPQPKQ